jgi:hypothetical protein
MKTIILGTFLVLGFLLYIVMQAYRGYKALIKVQDEEIVLGGNQDANLHLESLEDTWMEAFDEVLKESV